LAKVQEEKREGLLIAKITRRASPSNKKEPDPKEAAKLIKENINRNESSLQSFYKNWPII
jgi:hypothetical protein